MAKINKIIHTFFPYLVGLSLIFFIPTWGTIEIGKTYYFAIVMTIIGTVLFLGQTVSRQIILPSKKISLSMGILLVLVLLSAVFSDTPWIAISGRFFEVSTFAFMFVLALFITMGTLYLSSKKQIKKLLKFFAYTYVLGGLLQLLLIIFPQVFNLGTFNSIVSTFAGTWYDFGNLSLLVLFASLYFLYTGTHTKKEKILLYILGIFSLVFVGLVNIVPLYIIAVVSVGALLFTQVYKYGNQLKKYWFITLVFVASVLFFVFTNSIEKQSAKIGISYQEVKPSLVSSLSILKNTIVNDPLLGAGPNQYAVNWLKYKPEVVNLAQFFSTPFNAGFNSYLTLTTNYGIVTGLFILFLLVAYIVFGYKFLNFLSRKDDMKDEYHLTQFSYLASIVCMYFFFTSPIGVLVWILFILSIIIVLAVAHETEYVNAYRISIEKNSKIYKKIAFYTTFGIVALVCGYFLVVGFLKAYAYGLGEKAVRLSSTDPDTSITLLKTAYQFDQNDLYPKFASSLYFDSASKVGEIEITEENRESLQNYFKNTFTQSVQLGQIALNRNPNSLDNIFALLTIYRSVVPAVKDAYPESLVLINKGLELSPNNPAFILTRARIEYDNGNTEEAKKYATQAIGIKQNYADAYVFLSRIAQQENDLKQARAFLEAAILSDNTNVSALSDYANITLSKKEYSLSVQVLSQILFVNPNLHQARLYLASVYEELQDVQKALLEYKKLLVVFPENQQIKNKIADLEAGKLPVKSEATAEDVNTPKEN